MNKIVHRRMTFILLLSLSTLLMYQNCGQNFKTISAESLNEGFSVELSSQAPSSANPPSTPNPPLATPDPSVTPIGSPETIELKVNNLQGYPGDDFVFEAQLTKALENDVKVNYSTSGLTAKAGEDFIAASGEINLPKGTLTQKIRIHSLNTRKTLQAKSFSLNLNISYLGNSYSGIASATIRELKLVTPKFKSAYSSTIGAYCGLSVENKILCWERALVQSDSSSKGGLRQIVTPTIPSEMFYVRPNWRDDWICYLDAAKDVHCRRLYDQTWSKITLIPKPQQSFTSFFPTGACTTSSAGQTSCIQLLSSPSVSTTQSALTTGLVVVPKPEEIVSLADQMQYCRIEPDQSASCGSSGLSPSSGNYEMMSSKRFVDLLGQGELKSVSQTSNIPYSCLLDKNGTHRCNSNSYSNFSKPPPGILFKEISSKAYDLICGITFNDQILCWGSDFHAFLKKGTLLITDKFKPISIDVDSNIYSQASSRFGCFLNIDRTVYCFDTDLNVYEMSNFKNANHEIEKIQTLGYTKNLCVLTKAQQIVCSGTLPTSPLTVVGKSKYIDFVNIHRENICAITTLGDLECSKKFEMTEFVSKNQFGSFLSLKSHLGTLCGLTSTEKLVCMGSFIDYSATPTRKGPSLLTSPENTRVFQTSSLKDFWVGQNFISYSTKFGSLRWLGSLSFHEYQFYPINYLEE